MIPIHELLNRIRWDREFGKGRFELGYLDHVAARIIRVPLSRLRIEPGDRFCFHIETETGRMQAIPFHRVREVLRDGNLIWRRSGTSEDERPA